MKRKQQIFLPDTIIDTYAACPEAFYPNMKVVLKICTTLLMTTVTIKQTFSVLKLLKTYLRSTMLETRLHGLAMIYIYRDLVLNIDVGIDEFGKSNRQLEERILFHYNGHGVPRPTANGEIWVFNKNFTQYIPLSLYDLQKWMSSPSIYVFDCSHAGVVLNLFVKFAEQIDKELEEARRNLAQTSFPSSSTNVHPAAQIPPLLPTSSPIHDILLGACSENELLPMNPELPADLFTSCLTTPIRIALRWYVLQKNLFKFTNHNRCSNIGGNVGLEQT
ncbi:unnamed protein product [Rotaria sordida]|uniref:Raptor N-terminal CASPase-like domain-containing protein n=1 Tax=Rotaria sordida TaxID=392033 RepID=A0A819HU20_9BILA|nr:unnamed protein product [Rotaria sordida]